MSEIPTISAAEQTPAAACDRSAGEPVRAAGLRKFFSLENRYLAPMLITCILLVGQVGYGVLESWKHTLLAIGTSILCELVLGKFLLGKYPNLASAYISGISVGILIRSPFYWPFALCAAISITSKYVLRWQNRHLWNPSNFGVSAMLFLYPAAAVSLSIQWGNFLTPMLVVWFLGALIISRLKRFHICLTYVISFIALSGIRSLVTGHPFLASVAPLTGPMYQLYVFFMITDPRTTVSTKRGQMFVAFLVAVVEMLLRLNEVIHAPYYSLFLVGPVALAWELNQKRRAAADRDKSPEPAFEAAEAEQPAEVRA